METGTLLIIYAAAVNFITFLLFGLDRHSARIRSFRIPSAAFIVLAAFGGAAGAVLGMLIFRTGTRKIFFPLCILLILILRIVLFLYIYSSFDRIVLR